MTYCSSHSPPCSPSSSCPCRHDQPIGHLNLSPTHPKEALTAPEQVPDARSIQQNHYAPLPPSAIRSVTRRSTTWNIGMTGTHPDSVQVAREYAQMNIHVQPLSFVGFSEYPSTNGQRGNVGRGGMHPNSFLARENPTPRPAAARDDHDSSLHPKAIIDTRNRRSESSSSSLTTVSPSATTFVSSRSPPPPGRSPADAPHDRVLRNLGSWLSTHEYLNTGQDPIIGHNCPPDADVLGIKGRTVLTAFFDHTDRETFRCYVCSDTSYDLEDAIIHQHRAMHHQD